MKGYLINLDSSTERLKTFDERLMALGFQRVSDHPVRWVKGSIEIERLPAVDGRKMSPEALERYRVNKPLFWDWMAHKLTPGEIGCFLSHRKFWEKMLNDGHEVAFVLEDDMQMAQDILAFWEQSDWVPRDADFVKLNLFPTDSSNLFPVGLPVGRVGNRNIVRTMGRIYGTGCYVLTAKAAQRCLNASTVMSLPVDLFMFDARFDFAPKTVLYTVLPGVAQDDGLTPSSIGGNRNKDSLTLSQHILKGAYSCMRRFRLKWLMKKYGLH